MTFPKLISQEHSSVKKMKRSGSDDVWRLAEEEARAATSRAFSAYGRTLEMVPLFRYLGRLLSAEDIDWLKVTQNLTKERAVWWRMSSILSR